MIQIQSFPFNDFVENTFVVWDETLNGVIIDPGCATQTEQNKLVQFIEKKGITVQYLLNTHGHIDHIVGNPFVKKQWNPPFLAHELIVPEITVAKNYGAMYGFVIAEDVFPTQFIDAGDTVKFGNTTFSVLYTPGHARSHLSFYEAESKSVFSGDVLFDSGVGRWDFPGGDFDILMQSIFNELLTLPEETTVYCGHGNETTIGREKRLNPYVKSYLKQN